MVNQAMRKVDPFGFRQQHCQIVLNLHRVEVFRQPQKSREALDVRIDDNSGRQAKSRAKHHVCRLSSDTRQGDHLVERPRQLPTKLIDQRLSHAAQVCRLRSKKPGRLDDLLDIRLLRSGQSGGSRILREQRRRDHVDPLVRALRREDGGCQQLKRGVVLQRALGSDVGDRQLPRDFEGTLLSIIAGFSTLGLRHVELVEVVKLLVD